MTHLFIWGVTVIMSHGYILFLGVILRSYWFLLGHTVTSIHLDTYKSIFASLDYPILLAVVTTIDSIQPRPKETEFVIFYSVKYRIYIYKWLVLLSPVSLTSLFPHSKLRLSRRSPDAVRISNSTHQTWKATVALLYSCKFHSHVSILYLSIILRCLYFTWVFHIHATLERNIVPFTPTTIWQLLFTWQIWDCLYKTYDQYWLK